MSRRALPPRATRGTKPPKTEEEERRDNELYAKMFGKDLDDDEDYILKQAQENARRERTLKNLRKYSYARGYTYCFDLDTFPRDATSPSYALDSTNIFRSTYSKEAKQYLSTPLSQLINRTLFGLPHTEGEQRGEGHSKNACHGFLFETEDKKYQLDRSIVTYRIIERRLQKIGNRGNEFALVRRDPELEEALKVGVETGRQALRKKIIALQQRKTGNVSAWYCQDDLFFKHSLNQQLHERIDQLKKQTLPNRLIRLLYSTEIHHQNAANQSPLDASQFLRKALAFYSTDRLSITEGLFDSLKGRSQRLLSRQNDKATVIFPLQVFHFGTQAVREAINIVLSYKIQQESQVGFYTAKFAWRKLFKAELSSQKVEKIKTEQLTALARHLVEEAKYFFKKTSPQQPKISTIDHLLNSQALTQGQGVPLFIGEATEMNGREFAIVCLYSWLCKAYSLLLPFADHNPDLPKLVSSGLFERYSYGFVEATGSAILGTLSSNLNHLCQVVASTEVMNNLDVPLSFFFDSDTGVGILSRRIEEVWETEKEEMEGEGEGEEQEEEVSDSPSKKRKENE